MMPAMIPNTPFYRYRGEPLCWYCDSHATNSFWYCDHCKPHKTLHAKAKKAEEVYNGW